MWRAHSGCKVYGRQIVWDNPPEKRNKSYIEYISDNNVQFFAFVASFDYYLNIINSIDLEISENSPNFYCCIVQSM